MITGMALYQHLVDDPEPTTWGAVKTTLREAAETRKAAPSEAQSLDGEIRF